MAGVTRLGSAGGGAFRPQGKVLPEHARRHNRSLVIHELLRYGPLARVDLARATQLTAATIGDLVGNLLEEGLVEERGRRTTGTGKPATLLGIVPDARHMVCVDLSDQSRFVGGVVNLTGEVVSRRSSARRGRTGAAAVQLVGELIAKLMADTDCPVLGVGVGSPGVVFADGTVEESSNLHWHHVALAADLTREAQIPVHVVNDANAAALGELQFGLSSSPNVLLVKIGLGVGAGLILDGHLIEGDGSAAGEIGHVVVDTSGDGDLCACGNHGCLETVVAGPALRARIEGRDKQASAQILAQAGERLGMALAPVVSMLNLREVLLSGPPDLLGEPFRQATTAAIKQRTFPLVGSQLEVRLGTTGRDDVLLGTAAVVLKHELVVRR